MRKDEQDRVKAGYKTTEQDQLKVGLKTTVQDRFTITVQGQLNVGLILQYRTVITQHYIY